jgi:hypothetical protein
MRIVEWKEQVTETGIQLAGTSTTVPKRGELIGTQAIPLTDSAGRMGIAVILVIRRFEDNRVIGLDSAQCRCVEEALEPLKKADEA